MNRIVISSLREGAGKTSIIVGLMSALKKNFGYIKPFGDRLIYKRKRNWDYDSNLIIDIFGLSEDPESITLGFDHAKLKYVYDEEGVRNTLVKIAENVGREKDLLVIEGGKDITYGSSLHLDSISVAKYLKGALYVVVSGDSDTIIDDITYLKEYVNMSGCDFRGVLINKLKDIDEFEDIYIKDIRDIGVPVAGIIPFKEQLTHFTVSYLAEKLYAKVIAGEAGLGNIVKNIFVGAMSTDETMRNPLFNKDNKFLITSGDRNDMILAALESETVGILLTNNILPPSTIISRAAERRVPLLLVTSDTYQVTRQIDGMEALLTKDNQERIRLLAQLTEKYINLDTIGA
ncbi:MAG: AAA family ATPase [Spirochaetes bacterium]|nr:AAA family ATPase [Spirochaetota bacterium]